jgi:hypothetical protein
MTFTKGYLVLKCPKCGRASIRENNFRVKVYKFKCFYCMKSSAFRDARVGMNRIIVVWMGTDFALGSEVVRRYNAPARYYEKE